jgi:hypothetical protein
MQGEMACVWGQSGWREVPVNGLLIWRNGSSRETGQQKTLPVPKSGSPVHALIEFVFWLRLGEEIAGKALFIEEEGSGVILLP